MADPIDALLEQLEPKVRDAFLAAIADIRSEAQLSVIIGALERGDVEAAVQALNLKAEFFRPLDDALRAAYIEGGVAALAGLPVIPDPFPAGAWLSGLMAGLRARSGGLQNKPEN